MDAMNASITELTDGLIASYARSGGINHLDGKNLPSKSAIAAITTDLLRLLFPGFFDEKPIHSSELKVETANLMDSVLGRLEDEICKSIEYRPPEGFRKKNLAPWAINGPGNSSPLCPKSANSCKRTQKPPSTAIPPH